MNTSLQQLREWVLKNGTIALIAVLPLLFFYGRVSPHMSSKSFFLYGATIFLGVLWIYTVLTDTSWRWSRKQLLWVMPAKLLVVWMTIAGLFAVNTHLAFWSSLGRGTGLLTWYSALVLLYIIVSLIRKYDTVWLYSLWQWMMVSTVVLGLSIWFGDEGLTLPFVALQKSSGGGLIGNSSLAAGYAFFVFCIGALLLLKKQTKIWRGVTIAAMVTLLTSPIFLNVYGGLTGGSFLGSARGAILGLFVAVAVSAVMYLVLSVNKKLKVLGVTLAIAGLVVFGYGWQQLVQPGTALRQKFTDSASGTRFIFWEASQKAMDERPVFGYGPENYMLAFQRYFDPRMISKEFNNEAWNDRAHNIYYEMGVQAGYPGIALYGIVLLMIIAATYSAVAKGKISQWQGAVIVGALVGYVFQNLFVFDSISSIVALFVLYGAVVGLLSDEVSAYRKWAIEDETVRWVLAGVLAIISVYGWYNLAYLPSRKALQYGTIFDMALNVRPAQYKKLLEGSRVGEDWDVSGLAHDTFRLYAKDSEGLKNNAKVLPYAIKDLEAFLPYLEEVAARNPTDYRLQLKIIHLYSTYIYLSDKKLDPELAKHILSYGYAAQKLSPTEPEGYWAVGQISLWTGDLATAQAMYEKAVSLDRTLAVSWGVLLSFYQGTGDQKNYQNTLLQAQKAIPDFSVN